MKSVKTDEFFKLIAIHSGVGDLETVRNVFYGMIKTISRELKEKHTVKLPDWGEFNLKIHKERRAKDVNYKKDIIIQSRPTVKFTPNQNVKKYFYSLNK